MKTNFTDDAGYDAYRERDVAQTPREIADAIVAVLMAPPLTRTYICVGCDSDVVATGWTSGGGECKFCGVATPRYTTGTVRGLRSVR